MIGFLVSFALLSVSSILIKSWFKLLVKPTYMMEITEYSRSALSVEKAYKLFILGSIGLACLGLSIALFLEEFSQLPM